MSLLCVLGTESKPLGVLMGMVTHRYDELSFVIAEDDPLGVSTH